MERHEDVVVVVQDELQIHCRSRETWSFGTPDAVVCKAARSASAVLAAVGRSVGIGARAGAGFGTTTLAAGAAKIGRHHRALLQVCPNLLRTHESVR